MENICNSIISQLTIDKLLNIKEDFKFVRIRHNPVSNRTFYDILDISENNLGDLYDFVLEKEINGILVFMQYSHIHQLFDYVNKNQIYPLLI